MAVQTEQGSLLHLKSLFVEEIKVFCNFSHSSRSSCTFLLTLLKTEAKQNNNYLLIN